MQDNILNSFQTRKGGFESRLQELKNQQSQAALQQPSDIGDFQRLNDAMAKNPDTKMWSWASAQPEVEEKEKTVMLAFNSYMFELAKGQFFAWCKENNLPYVNDYVDAVLAKAKDYVTPEDEFKQDRVRYESRISDLENKLTSFMNSKEKEVII